MQNLSTNIIDSGNYIENLVKNSIKTVLNQRINKSEHDEQINFEIEEIFSDQYDDLKANSIKRKHKTYILEIYLCSKPRKFIKQIKQLIERWRFNLKYE